MLRAMQTGIIVLVALTVVAPSAALAQSKPAERSVQFIVSIPPGDRPDKIFVSMSSDNWPEGGRALRSLGDGVYSLTFTLPADAAIEYKFLRTESWSTVEKDASGEEISNRTLAMPHDGSEVVVFHGVARWANDSHAVARDVSLSTVGHQPAAGESKVTGRIDVLDDVESPQLGNKRRIFVLLPDGYDDKGTERYPVLYMHDGQNLFDATASTAHVEWGIDEAAERLAKTGKMRKAIIVGISNNRDRMKEYSPYPDRNFGGDAEKYLAFIVETLKPRIDAKYHTLADRENTGIAGSSMGGLVSLYAITKYPNVFGSAGVISPSLYWAGGKIMADVQKTEFKKPIRLWIDIGTSEGSKASADAEVTKAVADCRALAEQLNKHGLKEGTDFAYVEVNGGMHNEAAWAARADQFLAFLLPPAQNK